MKKPSPTKKPAITFDRHVSGNVFPIIDFALRIAKALKESQSSTALFFVQQAYPDDIEGLDQPSNNQILDNIITLASEEIKHFR